MKITAIKPAVKTKGRYNIFVDGKYSFSLDEQQVLDLQVKVGREINDQDLTELKAESDFGKKYARAFELILRRSRSEKEIRDYAWRKKWEPEETSRIIEKLISKKYLDDEKFAASWVRTRAILKHVSRRKLILELRQKGVSSDIIEQAIGQSEDYNEAQALNELIEKKRTRYADQQKFMAYLLRQGFGYDEIKQALKGD
jgi:regulatory protein